MLNFFKKKRIKGPALWELNLLISVAKKLPERYHFLLEQINTEFILDSIPNDFLGNNWKRLVISQKLYNKIKKNNPDLNCKIIGIQVFSAKEELWKEMELDLYEGVLIGYRIDTFVGEIDLSKIITDDISEVAFVDFDKNALKKILGRFATERPEYFDIDSTFKMEIEGKEYFAINNLGDGDFIGIDLSGAIYLMTHDPFSVEKIFEDSGAYVSAIDSGKFKLRS